MTNKPISYTSYTKEGDKFIPQYGKLPGFDFDRLTIPKLEPKNGGMFARPQYKSPVSGQTGDLDLQLPVGKTPFGFSSFEDKKKPGEFDTSMSINVDPKSDFGKWCTDYLEERMIDYVHKHSVEFFRVQHDKPTLKALSNGIIRYAQDPIKAVNNPPTFKASINEKKQKNEDKNKPQISYNPKQYWAIAEDANGRQEDITAVARGAMIRMIVKLVNFYIVNGKWGLSWSLVKCIVVQPGGNANVQADPNMYPDEAIFLTPAAPPAGGEDDDMKLIAAAEAAEAAEATKKREREAAAAAAAPPPPTPSKGKAKKVEEEVVEEEEEEQEEEQEKKKPKKSATAGKKNK